MNNQINSDLFEPMDTVGIIIENMKEISNQKNENIRCALCRGTKGYCGKDRCPILVKYYANYRVAKIFDVLELAGSTPPSVFVGRFGYPKIELGPLVPPILGDTSILDAPEHWLGKGYSIDDIVSFRTQLVRGKITANVYDVENGGKLIDITREVALAARPIDLEVSFTKKPSGNIFLDDEAAPFGPSAEIANLSSGNVKIDFRIEKTMSDRDLNAKDAILYLYQNGTNLSTIQRAFSIGAFGEKKKRRFVPTRWSITAVDSILGLELLAKTKTYPIINEYRVYESLTIDNRFIVILLPSCWSYELVEAWYPKTTWNAFGNSIVIFSDHEGYNGRKTYAKIGGCYYAARLAVNELLEREKRQAACIVLRETYPGHILPLGVWNVRENVRRALSGSYMKFQNLKDTLNYISTRLKIGIERWVKNSALLHEAISQKKIDEYF
ncbi:MAG: Nre family DNA repair protein [Thermoplasmata archaeon]